MDWQTNMANDTKFIHNVETDEIFIVELTDEEQQERNIQAAEILTIKEAKLQEATETLAKRQALLDKLGITEEEARLLLGGN